MVIESRHGPGKRFSLPVLSRLYLNKSAAKKWQRAYHKKNDLMLQMVALLERHVAKSDQTLHWLGDSAFTAPAVLAQLPASMHSTGRVGSNVRIHQAPPQRRQGQVRSVGHAFAGIVCRLPKRCCRRKVCVGSL